MPLLELSNVEARYGQIRALHGVSLTVDEGEVVSLLGANGAGKTTTLRAISGAVRKSGDVAFDPGARSRSAPESIARLGVARARGARLFGELSVWDNLRMGAYVRGERRTFKTEARRACSATSWLEGRKNQQAGTLSGGEQQMLSLARALVSRPRLAHARRALARARADSHAGALPDRQGLNGGRAGRARRGAEREHRARLVGARVRARGRPSRRRGDERRASAARRRAEVVRTVLLMAGTATSSGLARDPRRHAASSVALVLHVRGLLRPCLACGSHPQARQCHRQPYG